VQIRPASNNTGLRVYNDTGGTGQVVEVEIEPGDEGTLALPPGYKLTSIDTNELGQAVWGFGPA
jgi:hypothetical protein